MYQKFLILILITVLFISCSKNEPEVITPGSEEESPLKFIKKLCRL